MTSNEQGHRMLHVSQQFRKNAAWGLALATTLLGVVLAGQAQAAVFTVNSPADVVDANPGNGVCETAAGNGVCTLRAALQEANALAGADEIILPPNTYLLTIVTDLDIQGSLSITGGGGSATIFDGNRSARFPRGTLSINSAVTGH